MRTSLTFLAFVLVVAALTASSPSSAQKREGLPRNQPNGGVANPVANGVFKVVSVDSYARTVKMEGAAGTIDVYVGEGVYGISKLKPGDQIQVNFLVPDGLSNKLSAAGIWPVKASK